MNEITGRPLHPSLRMHFIVRAILLGAVFWIAASAFERSGGTLLGRVAMAGGDSAAVMLLVLAILWVVGMADLVANDLMPPNVTLPLFRRNRHKGYFLLGALLFMLAGSCIASREPGAWLAAGTVFVPAIGCLYFSGVAVARSSHAL